MCIAAHSPWLPGYIHVEQTVLIILLTVVGLFQTDLVLLVTLRCLFILLMVSYAVQNLFSLKYSHLFVYSFVSLAQGDILQKLLL